MRNKPITLIMSLVAFVMVVSLACGPTPQPTATAVPTTPPEPTKAPVQPTEAPTAISEPTATSAPTGLITSISDAKKAIIQIESQGTFIDPEFGYMQNAAGRGSGFIIDPSGIAVTNNHVVTGAALLKVWVGGDSSKTYNARILGVSECSDLAVIDIEGDGFPYFNWYSGKAEVGLEVFAAGFPLGDPEFTLTKGIVSKEKASGETSWASVDAVLEHDATINPGNSGGPLLDKNGNVVGINYAGSSSTKQYYAINREVAVPLIDQLRSGKDVDSIGVNGQAVMSSDGTLYGIWVSSVKSGSAADKAGLKGGDIITELESLAIADDGTMSSYCDVLRTHRPEDTLSLFVLRWLNQELLEGQINGRPLTVYANYSDTSDTGSTGGDTGSTGGDTGSTGGDTGSTGDLYDADGNYLSYVTVTDDTGAISVEIPAAWYDVDGSVWTSNWGSSSFDSPSISASEDLDAYFDGYSESGVFFAASKRLGQLGGYVQLLDGVKGWYRDDCDFEGRYDYGADDPLYEGKYDIWENCGADNTVVLILAARPKADPTAYLLLLELKVTKDADLDALETILASFVADF